ncbi:MAG: tRNA (adenosine(37)-N6)-threonylcarbamoyltransferase complex dimerization subunit type 1 TsaB [Gemmataceae bacterium]|jgi:tRNA threonylcarbamoyladenosine biosynthesis protein TsaB|nr:tRNA (adenosine(37)-N6)-threonylcarbamoyltransferase complex dimerization subunit type 1 TsaB [Gemmataceae bacterium]
MFDPVDSSATMPEVVSNGGSNSGTSDPWLLIETSGRTGQVGLARRGEVILSRLLDPSRRHARDLTPAVVELLQQAGIAPAACAGVMVSLGPGSFTGLRVGVMSAKTFAYATGCALRAVPTFAAVAEQAPPRCTPLWVVADALRGHAYAQLFQRSDHGWEAQTELLLLPWEQWRSHVAAEAFVSGPGALQAAEHWPELALTPPETHHPTLQGLYAAGSRMPDLSRSELFALEPLYIRPSYAEEQRRPASSP